MEWEAVTVAAEAAALALALAVAQVVRRCSCCCCQRRWRGGSQTHGLLRCGDQQRMS
jgi:hypothetical protein